MDNDDAARRGRAARFATMPIVLAGTIAVAAGLTGPVAHATDRHHVDDDSHRRDVGRDDVDRNVGHGTVFGTAVATSAVVAQPVVAVAPAPATYTVAQGDTVSAIAARYGLAARDVLARNGLSWNTIIHPGQTLHLGGTSATAVAAVTTTAATSSYHVVQGDTVSAIAARLGVATSALLAANSLSSTSVIYPGQTLSVPSATASASTGAAATPIATPAAPATTTAKTVTIAAGQTIATIAAANGVAVSALLSANGLTYTSTIYAGKTLVIPATSGLSATQRANAATIVAVGRSLGVPSQGIVIALAAAMQESGLQNLDHGDRDSVGVFQQRPSQGWGTDAQLMDVAYTARLFFGGPSNPNAGTTRGLLDVPGWQSMSLTQAAQSVQVSAFPDAYAQWQQPAETWLATL